MTSGFANKDHWICRPFIDSTLGGIGGGALTEGGVLLIDIFVTCKSDGACAILELSATITKPSWDCTSLRRGVDIERIFNFCTQRWFSCSAFCSCSGPCSCMCSHEDTAFKDVSSPSSVKNNSLQDIDSLLIRISNTRSRCFVESVRFKTFTALKVHLICYNV